MGFHRNADSQQGRNDSNGRGSIPGCYAATSFILALVWLASDGSTSDGRT